MFRNRVGLIQVITPALASVERNAYHWLHQNGLGIMDGGFGEIALRQLMNRIVIDRKLHRDLSNRPLPCPDTVKAGIFSPEIHHMMVRGSSENQTTAWENLPSCMNVANKADLFSVRSHLPYFFGFEQNYLDNVCLSYMPYAQPSVLRSLFQVPLRLRWHGRLLRQFIRQQAPALARFPLVKGSEKYPFQLGTISSFVYSRVKKRFGYSYL